MPAGCASARVPGGYGESTSPPPHPPMRVSVLPGDKAQNIDPALPTSVRVSRGVLQQVALTDQTGKTVPGALSPDHHSW
ncbi:MAG: Ig-like domain-containing protein, partial [Pseudonocardiaceae bacterium]